MTLRVGFCMPYSFPEIKPTGWIEMACNPEVLQVIWERVPWPGTGGF